MTATETIIATYTIDGFKIPLIRLPESHDVRFMPQKQLFALATPAAYAELYNRAEVIRSRAG